MQPDARHPLLPSPDKAFSVSCKRVNFLHLAPIVSFAILLSLLTLAACSPGGPPGAHGGFPPPNVIYEVINAREVAIDQEYVGQTAGSREIEIRTRVNGIIEKRLFEEGVVVRKGQPLFKLDAALFAAAAAQANAAVGTAEANVKQAEREFNRLTPLRNWIPACAGMTEISVNRSSQGLDTSIGAAFGA